MRVQCLKFANAGNSEIRNPLTLHKRRIVRIQYQIVSYKKSKYNNKPVNF